MKPNVVLTIVSLISIFLMTLHLTDDILRGMAPGGVVNMIGVLILVVWLYGTVALAGRRAGYLIVLAGSLLGASIPVIHMRGAGLGGAIARSGGAFLFVWTLLALGVTAIFSAILSARSLIAASRGAAPSSPPRRSGD